jgi:nucleotide-binding universal stress UspA family protein
MPYKTILVHLNGKRRAEAVLGPAVHLARHNNAHLIGLHVYPNMPVPPIDMVYGAHPPSSVVSGQREEAEAVGSAFVAATANQPFVAEARSLKVPHIELAGVVMDHGRAADLIVAGQADPGWDLSGLMDFPERLAVESGRPVLVVPYIGRYGEIGRNVVIAWKAGRESARAVFDALPILQAADKVHILEVKERADDVGVMGPDTTIAASLSRHGIKPTVQTSVAADISIGNDILSRLSDLNADLLVMGAYGHSRMHELVFGGVTRHIFRHMTVPTLFSH